MGAKPLWDFAAAPPHSAPGVSSMLGYRTLGAPEPVHRGLPSSRLTFIVSLDDGVEAGDSPETLSRARPAPIVLGGLHLRTAYVRQRPGQAGVQVALHPLAARTVLGLTAAEVSAHDFDGGAVLGRAGSTLHDRLTEVGDWPAAFAVVARFLTDRAERRDAAVRPELRYAWELLERSGGTLPIGVVARNVGLSSRHLATLFRREVGRSPKVVAELMRFEHATARIAAQVRRTGRADLAGIAVLTGYSDQAHLSREFARFAGVPPRRWMAEEFRNLQDGGHAAGAAWVHE